jgi:hypothetical protein
MCEEVLQTRKGRKKRQRRGFEYIYMLEPKMIMNGVIRFVVSSADARRIPADSERTVKSSALQLEKRRTASEQPRSSELNYAKAAREEGEELLTQTAIHKKKKIYRRERQKRST